MQNFGKKIGFSKKLHAHIFRHSCATILLNNGADIKTVQQKLCHVSIETTAIYLHISNEQLKKATDKLAIY